MNTNKICKHRAISEKRDIIPIEDANLNRLRKCIKCDAFVIYNNKTSRPHLITQSFSAKKVFFESVYENFSRLISEIASIPPLEAVRKASRAL